MEPTARRARLTAARLYVVTDARLDRGDLTEFLDAVLGAGTDIVQLRQKDAEARDLLRWSEVFREAAERHSALFVVNDRPDLALVAGADGVHVGQNDLPVALLRQLVGPELIIGLSTHGEDQRRSAPLGADYLCVGPIHATPTKLGRPAIGLEPVRRASAEELRPWFAIGGVDPRTLPQVIGAGARRIVVVRAVTEAPDPSAAVRALRSVLDRAARD
jgi:thiamine-phosphate pyrophosphorylase